jgi:hypothetical protein
MSTYGFSSTQILLSYDTSPTKIFCSLHSLSHHMMTLPTPCTVPFLNISSHTSTTTACVSATSTKVMPRDIRPTVTAPQCRDDVNVLAFTLARSSNRPTARSRCATKISEIRDKKRNRTKMHPRTKIFAVQTQAGSGSRTLRFLPLEVRMPNLKGLDWLTSMAPSDQWLPAK